MAAARTVVKIRQTAAGWKGVKTTVPAEEHDDDYEEKAAAAEAPAEEEAPLASEVVATPAAAAPQAVPAKRPAKTSSLLSLAKRRASSKEDQEASFDFDDPRFNKQPRLAAAAAAAGPRPRPPSGGGSPPPAAVAAPKVTKAKVQLVAKAKGAPQQQKTLPRPTGLAALARRRSAIVMAADGSGELAEAPEEEDEYAMRLTTKQTHSGVVVAAGEAPGDLLIECAAIEKAFGQRAVIRASGNAMGARIGSIVCFRLAPHDGDWLDMKQVPVATRVVVNGFQASDESKSGRRATGRRPL